VGTAALLEAIGYHVINRRIIRQRNCLSVPTSG
jgi:hypothetical protein